MAMSRKRARLIGIAAARNKGLVALVAIGLVLLAAIMAFFHALYTRQTSSAISIREDALWAAHQTDRETGKLVLALSDLAAGRAGASLAEVSRRFDILYSRYEVMKESDFSGKFRADPQLTLLTEKLSQRLGAMLPIFDGFVETKRATPEALELALAEVEQLRSLTEDLLVATNHLQSSIRVDDRVETSRIYGWLAGAVVALMLAMGAVIVLMWRQLKQIEISRHRLQRLSEELAQSAAAAEAGNRAKSAFLATMSHEIRTPLNGIIGTAELMNGGRLDREQISQLGIIRQCSDALIALINDILDFSKLESGTIDLERRPVDLADMVDGVIEMLAPRAEAKGIELVASYPMRVYETDAARLSQVLINLVGNAVKFTDHGSVTVRIWEIGGRDDRATLRVQVDDTGIGISAAHMSRLFTEFTQADASISRRFGGTGLGLAICKRIIEAMDGRIGVESFEGKGTIFWFEVPVGKTASRDDERIGDGLAAEVVMASRVPAMTVRRDLGLLGVALTPAWRAGTAPHTIITDVAGFERAEAEGNGPDPATMVVIGLGARRFEGRVAAVLDGPVTTRRLARIVAHRRRGTTSQSSKAQRHPSGGRLRFRGHVLVVEDNPVNRKVAVGILSRMGFTAETVVDGLQAVERLARGGVDLVMMDMQMPVMDGLEATRRVRGEPGPSREVPIVGLTANAFASDRAACFEAGMNDFVVKPVTRERLEAALSKLVHSEEEEAMPMIETLGAAEPPTEAGAAPIDEVGPIDHDHRRRLVEAIDEAGVAELTELFFDDAAGLMTGLATAHAAGDVAEVRRVLHTLSGAAANVGCIGVVAAIEAIRATGVTASPGLVDRLAAALLTAQTALGAQSAAVGRRDRDGGGLKSGRPVAPRRGGVRDHSPRTFTSAEVPYRRGGFRIRRPIRRALPALRARRRSTPASPAKP